MKYCMMIALMAFPLVVFAAPPDKDIPPARAHEEWNEQLETLLIAKLTHLLDLKTEQAKLFFPILNEFQTRNKTFRHDRQESMLKLRKLGESGNSATSAEVDRTVRELSENQRLQAKSVTDFMTDAGKVLEPWQIARLQVFIIKFPERVEEIMREHMGNRQRFRGGDHDRDMDAPPPDDGK